MSHPLRAPTYIMRAGFVTASHGEVATNYAHWQLTRSFHFREVAAGAVDGDDFLAADFSRDIGDVFQRLNVGQGSFFLDNYNGKYSPTSRAAFTPGKVITLKAKRPDIKEGETAPRVEALFSGVITGYQITPAIGKSVARIDAEDRAAVLRNKVNLPMRLNTAPSSLAFDILVAAGIKSFDRSSLLSADDIPFSLVDDMTAGEALDRLVKAGGHAVHVDGRGRLLVLDRNFEFKTEIVATLTEFVDFGYNLPWDRVINDVRIASSPRQVSTTPQTVAWLDEAPSVPGSGGALAFFVSWIDVRDGQANETSVPVTSATTPVKSLDWRLTSTASGGADLTANAELALVPFARSGLVTIINSNSQPGFLSKFNVRGYPIAPLTPFTSLSQSSASIYAFGRRSFEISTDMIKALAFSQAYGDLILSRRSDATPVIEISVQNKWPQTLFIDIAKRILVTEAITGVNGAWTVRGVDHSISTDPGPSHVARYRLELAEARAYFVLDLDPEGKLDSDRTLAP